MTAPSTPSRQRTRTTAFSFAASLATLIGLMGYTPSSDARLKPYYFIEGLGQGKTTPKVLFALDSSGSMAWTTGSGEEDCSFSHCEDPNHPEGSRMAIARSVIQSIVQNTSDRASFSLMTFGRQDTPVSSGTLPAKCYNSYYGYYQRFTEDWDDTDTHRVWILCGWNKPYAYLRHDNLARNANLANNATGTIPPSPLNNVDYHHSYNRRRKVQFFPSYLGVRVHFPSSLDLDDCGSPDPNDPNSKLLRAVCRSYGDYGNGNNSRKNNVLGRDFYYWPYVDGFPRYSTNKSSNNQWLGVIDEATTSKASLLAPFFLEGNENSPDARIPRSEQEATELVLGHTNPLLFGGVDPSGGTPWLQAVGAWTNSPTQSNSPDSHTSIASYVSYVNQHQSQDGVCSPISIVMITDGAPNAANPDPNIGSWENLKLLYERLSDLRVKGKAETYVVGFGYDDPVLNNMACAAAGSRSFNSPCNSADPALTWDTCNSTSGQNAKCAYVASNKDELAARLTAIVNGALELSLESGPSTSVNEFGAVAPQDSNSSPDAIQTSVSAHTEWPGWKGTVKRSVCEDKETDPAKFVNGVPGLASWCDPSKLPFPDPTAERFGVCPLGRDWNAGKCLRDTTWSDRRLYFVAPNKSLVPISDGSGQASGAFRALFDSLYAGAAGDDAPPKPDADLFVQFLMGKDWPGNWKLPGLAQSSPIVVRRIPKKNLNYRPTVPIRDPHCAGRKLGTAINIPQSLEKFSDAAWDENNKVGSNPHLPFQEAVLVGDDMGVLHAFHLDSGNEMWGLLPHFALKSAIASYHHGPANMGQPAKLESHVFGLGGTVNNAYVYQGPTDQNGDPTNDANPHSPGKWRNLAVIGMGKGGQELMVLDVSHMSPDHPDGPVEVLWTSEDATTPKGSSKTLAETYDRILGETWSRPAISYHVSSGSLNTEPKAIMVLGSGYPEDPAPHPDAGRSYHVVDPLTGKLIESAVLPAATDPTYSPETTAVSDIAVATHCSSRFWGEAEEAYFVDSAGRLYRWDLGADTDHSGDSVKKWTGQALPAAKFLACQGVDSYDCQVQSGNKGEPFYFAPAVVSSNRIDDTLAEGLSGIADDYKDNFLIALVSGHLLDTSTDAGQENADFHPSIYLIADDHRGAANHGGLDIPANGAITQAGNHDRFFRIPLSQIRRSRHFVPFEGATPIVEDNQPFSRRARPVSAPRITVTGLVDSQTGEVKDGVEVFYVEFNIFEPGIDSCDPRLYDSNEKKRYEDPGSSYMVRLRLVTDDQQAFSFTGGAASLPNTMGADRYGFTKNGLEIGAVEQVKDNCEGGGCGPKIAKKKFRPCVPKNKYNNSSSGNSVGLGYKLLEGFSPIEYNTNADQP